MPDTIVAIATPIARSGIGVIRLSGENALPLVCRLTSQNDFAPMPRRAYLRKLFDADGELMDSVLITFYPNPSSFTGEDVVEISGHGSPVLLRQIVDLCLTYGARAAEVGEFTLRALTNGKINLSQAEAVRDLIDARTGAAAKQAVRQLNGELSRRLDNPKDELLKIIVVLESALEFVEDDLPSVQKASLIERLSVLENELSMLAATFSTGNLLRNGLKVALIGKPNVGKSSIFNVLLGEDRSIVTHIAGTTRDVLRESFIIEGIPVALYDTAGIRETADFVENLGVERSKIAIADADLVIAVFDRSEPFDQEDEEIISKLNGSDKLFVFNKSDLEKAFKLPLEKDSQTPFVEISAKFLQGFDDLRRAIIQPFTKGLENSEDFLISDARHFDLLNRAVKQISSAKQCLQENRSEEIVLVGLHNSLRFLGEITGETTAEDVLTRIFSTFCIGK